MWKAKEVPPGVEPRSLDSKSRVLTTTPWNPASVSLFILLILIKVIEFSRFGFETVTDHFNMGLRFDKVYI